MRSLSDVSIVVGLDELLNKQYSLRWFETEWRWYDATLMQAFRTKHQLHVFATLNTGIDNNLALDGTHLYVPNRA